MSAGDLEHICALLLKLGVICFWVCIFFGLGTGAVMDLAQVPGYHHGYTLPGDGLSWSWIWIVFTFIFTTGFVAGICVGYLIFGIRRSEMEFFQRVARQSHESPVRKSHTEISSRSSIFDDVSQSSVVENLQNDGPVLDDQSSSVVQPPPNVLQPSSSARSACLRVKSGAVDIPVFYGDQFFHARRGCSSLRERCEGNSVQRLTYCYLCGEDWRQYDGNLYFSPIAGKKYHIRRDCKGLEKAFSVDHLTACRDCLGEM